MNTDKETLHIKIAVAVSIVILIAVLYIFCNTGKFYALQEDGQNQSGAKKIITGSIEGCAKLFFGNTRFLKDMPGHNHSSMPVSSVSNSDNNFNEQFKKGLELYDKQLYRQAAAQFELARKIIPSNLDTKYYLLQCYSKIESKPYSPESKTIRIATEIFSLDPDSGIAEEALKILVDNENAIATLDEKKSAKKDQSAQSEAIASAEGKCMATDIPTPSTSAQVKETAVNEEKKPEQPSPGIREKIETLRQPEIAHVEGKITRPDDMGRFFNPQGVPVSLINTKTGEAYITATDETGKFTFSGIIPGNYALSAASEYKYTKMAAFGSSSIYSRRRPYNRGYNPYRNNSCGVSRYSSRGRFTNTAASGIKFNENNTGRPGGAGIFAPPSQRIDRSRSPINNVPIHKTINPLPHGCSYTGALPAEFDESMSWHLSVNIPLSGVYYINLDTSNSDSRYIPDLRPDIDPRTGRAFIQLTDTMSVPIN